MKKFTLPLFTVAIALLVASCGVDYPKADKANAKNACSCYGEVAKLAEEQIEYKIENYDKLVMDEKTKGNATQEEIDAFEKTEEYKAYEDMAKELGDLEEKAKKVCIEDWQKEKGKAYEAMADGLPGLASEFCPEIHYLVNDDNVKITEPKSEE